MAMDDAVCLSHILDAQRGDLNGALHAYQEAREVRTARGSLVHAPSGI
jgi:hypothetical protein